MTTLIGTTLVPGSSEGPVLTLAEPLSFWGGLDSATGTIIDRWHPQSGRNVAGQILVMSAGRGSSSGSSVLAEALRLGTGPSAILLLARDAIVVVGAMVAAELYGRGCPVVLLDEAAWHATADATRIEVAAGDAGATLTLG